MREYHVVCGGLNIRGDRPERWLQLDTDAGCDSASKINLDLGDISRPMVAGIPPRYADLVQIAAYIYCADQFSRRDTPQMREFGADWRRMFHFRIPVREPGFWNRREVKEALCRAVSFLSDDEYHFGFATARRLPALQEYLDLQESDPTGGFAPERIALFSGGLDSFAGAADALLQRGEQVALVSHCSAPMISGKQSVLIDALRQRTRPGQLFHVRVGVNKGRTEAAEYTQRSRSFLFATLGAVVARLFGRDEVVFYENGIVSLNLPFAEHVLGARATRTTHPQVLAGFANLFSLVAEREVRFANPFFWMTKADVIRTIVAAGAGDLIASTFSCTRTRDATRTGQHCGICSQCIDRRFGIVAAGAEQLELQDQYAVDLLTGGRAAGPDLTLAESFVLTASKFASMTRSGFLGRYAQVFRVLQHLPGSGDKNVDRLFELHKRHGADVTRVIDTALAEHSSLAEDAKLPATCLLSIIRTQMVRQPPLTDQTERRPAASQQVQSEAKLVLKRPIAIAIDGPEGMVLFEGGACLAGKLFKLIDQLHREHRQGEQQNLSPGAYPYVQASRLAGRLGITEQSLRQSVARARRSIREQFRQKLGAVIADDEIIQNQGWSGYRLNPYLMFRPRAVVEALNTRAQNECHISQQPMSQLGSSGAG